MPRKAPIDAPGALHHIILPRNRAAENQSILCQEDLYLKEGDERILGESDFVKKVLSEQKEQFERRYRLKAQGYDINRIVQKVAEVYEIEPEEIWKPGNQPLRVKAGSLVCY